MNPEKELFKNTTQSSDLYFKAIDNGLIITDEEDQEIKNLLMDEIIVMAENQCMFKKCIYCREGGHIKCYLNYIVENWNSDNDARLIYFKSRYYGISSISMIPSFLSGLRNENITPDYYSVYQGFKFITFLPDFSCKEHDIYDYLKKIDKKKYKFQGEYRLLDMLTKQKRLFIVNKYILRMKSLPLALMVLRKNINPIIAKYIYYHIFENNSLKHVIDGLENFIYK